MTSKFKVGDRVVPVDKSIGCSFWNFIGASEWGKEQPYLYVLGYTPDGEGEVRCSLHKEASSADWFLESDLKPYHEYTYLKTDFEYPDWWDGRPILCYVSDECRTLEDMVEMGRPQEYIIGIDPSNNTEYPFITQAEAGWKYAIPVPKTNPSDTKISIVVEKDGVKSDIVLTEEQIREIKEKLDL